MSSKGESLITIGIPFYNSDKYLEKAILSVFCQSYKDWKLILIDDGSDDNSLLIAKKFSNDHRVKIISDGINKNLSTRLNEIAKLCTTKYLARMDADDMMHPHRIEKQLKILEENPHLDVLGTNAYSINEKDQVQGIRGNFETGSPRLKKCKSFIHPSIMAKTEWFLNNPYDEKLNRAQDFELWQRSIGYSNFMTFMEPLLFYREIGSDYYKKFLKGFNTKIYIAHKLKSFNLYVESFMQLLKGILYYIFNLLNMESLLIQQRSFQIKEDLKKEAEIILKNISNHKILH